MRRGRNRQQGGIDIDIDIGIILNLAIVGKFVTMHPRCCTTSPSYLRYSWPGTSSLCFIAVGNNSRERSSNCNRNCKREIRGMENQQEQESTARARKAKASHGARRTDPRLLEKATSLLLVGARMVSPN
jgi:hypothetical protein